MNGILVVKKESDYTSRDVVNVLCKYFNTKKIGHTGTLDPIATGVLVICIGRYTKLVDKITSYDKEYIATIKLGIKTDTLDITGNILETSDVEVVDKQTLINTLSSFIGKSIQEVPLYSAVKIKGKKLYEYARKKESVNIPKREVEIKEIELLKNDFSEITFRVVVSKGTYIRSLIKDICNKLGILGTMSSLKRTRQGLFKIEDSFSIQEIKDGKYRFLSIEDIFPYKTYNLTFEEYVKIKNGAFLKLNLEESFLFMKYENKVLAIYKLESNYYRPYFML